MSHRRLASTGVLLVVTALVSLTPMPVDAQASASGRRVSSEGKAGSPPRTPWGAPDIQGIWDFRTVTPMERPEKFAGKEFLTDAEAVELEQLDAQNSVDRAPRAGDPGTYNQFWMDRGTKVIGTRRTSLIVDPPGGKIPPLTPEAKKRQAEVTAARRGVTDDVPRPGAWLEDCTYKRALHRGVQLGTADVSGGLQQQRSALPDSQLRGDFQRDGSQRTDRPPRRPPASRISHPPVARGLAWPLGR